VSKLAEIGIREPRLLPTQYDARLFVYLQRRCFGRASPKAQPSTAAMPSGNSTPHMFFLAKVVMIRIEKLND
jgi:hypothetical protein